MCPVSVKSETRSYLLSTHHSSVEKKLRNSHSNNQEDDADLGVNEFCIKI